MNLLLMVVLFMTAVFLILLVLVQRGKGGGLAGAFGGMGGQSAFGTKAGDLFTKITIGVATFWIVLCTLSVWLMGGSDKGLMDLRSDSPSATQEERGMSASPDADADAGGGSGETPDEPPENP